MKKKIVLASIFCFVMLLAISFASAVNTSTTTNLKKKESPLFKIRTKLAIGEKISKILGNIKANFIGERIFWMPLIDFKLSDLVSPPSIGSSQKGCLTCFFTCGIYPTDCGKTCKA